MTFNPLRERDIPLDKQLRNVLLFEPNKPVRDANERFEKVQQQINGGQLPPSEQVIEEHRQRLGGNYRLQTERPNATPRPRKESR